MAYAGLGKPPDYGVSWRIAGVCRCLETNGSKSNAVCAAAILASWGGMMKKTEERDLRGESGRV
jgi:predicted alpha/beta hydrolase